MKSSLFSLIIAVILAIFFIYAVLWSNPVKSEQIGLGEGTLPYFPREFGLPIQTDSLISIDSLKYNIEANGKGKRSILWLGNSQLFGINEYTPGQKNATELLFDSLFPAKAFVVAYSIPNANLQEHYVAFKYINSKFPINQLIIPVFFDDLRETGLRDDLLQYPLIQVIKNDSSISELDDVLKHELSKSAGGSDAAEIKALNNTTQERTELFLSKKLSSVSEIWNSRADIRTNIIYNYFYKFRNTILGITPSSKRRQIPSRYTLNMEAFELINKFAKKHNISVLVYIPPIRGDIEQPYIKEEYEKFKLDLLHYKEVYGFHFLNAEKTVPPRFWGLKQATTFNRSGFEVDFMHFKTQGHKLLADTITSILQKEFVK